MHSAAGTRIACLPGAYQTAADLVAAGFDDAVRSRALPVDLVFVEPKLEHLGDRSFRERLRREFVLPSRSAGCRSLWLAGISLGGFMALDYVVEHPGDVDGVCLLAPYLGNRLLTGEIAAAGGLAAWNGGPLAELDEERRLWEFVKATRMGSPPVRSPIVHLGYGRDDRFAAAHRLLAAILPPESVDVVDGGHDFGTWKRLWENFLDSRFR